MHTRDRGPDSQTGRCQRAEAVEHVKSVDEELLFVASDPALQATVHTISDAGSGIKFFLREHGILLDVVADYEHGRKRVGELQDTSGANEGGEICDLRDGGCDYPCEGPVDWDCGGFVISCTQSDTGLFNWDNF
jgi:hypothetical protein